MDKNNIKLEHEITFGWLIMFAMPTILSSIFMNLYSTVDGIFVARLVDTDALSAAAKYIAAASVIMMAYNIFSSGRFTALNDGKTSAILSFCRTIVFMVVPVLILPELLGIDGVWLSMAVGELLSLGMTVYYFVKFKNVWRKEA